MRACLWPERVQRSEGSLRSPEACLQFVFSSLGPFLIINLGSKFSGYCFGLCADACACDTSKSCVPLSRCTFLLVEVISEPCVLLEAAELKLSPSRPKTPWLLEASWPAAFKPPPAPRAAPAAFPVRLTALLATPRALAAVLVTAPVAAPAVERTPPRAPPPLPRADPTAPPPADKSSLATELEA